MSCWKKGSRGSSVFFTLNERVMQLNRVDASFGESLLEKIGQKDEGSGPCWNMVHSNEMMFQLVELRTVHVIIQASSEWPLKCAWNVTNAGGFSTQVRHRPEVVSSKCLPTVLCGRRWPVSSLSPCSVSLHILHIISYGGGRAEPTMSTGHISAIRGLISRLSGRAGWMMNIIWQIFPIFTFCWVKFWVTKNEVGSRERGGYLRVEDGWFVAGREGWRRWRENVEWYDDG